MRHLASLLVLATACSGGQEYEMRTIDMPAVDWSAADVEPYEGGGYATLELDGSMDGRLPGAGAFENADGYGEATYDSWGDNGWMRVEMNTLTDDGWAMVAVDLNVDESTGEATWDTYSVVGCSGPEEDWADFDEAPEQAELTAEVVTIDGQDFVELKLEGDFRGDNNAVGIALLPAAQ
ncbi:MAG: hypothetical protein H6736_10800 [Alphaproteobacteria bacterium]|nr:hypothetical protein [Alphaproteobacteria bacterium]